MKTREQWYDELFDGACVSNSRARVERRLAIIDEIARQAKVEALEKHLSECDGLATAEQCRYHILAELNRLKKGSQ